MKNEDRLRANALTEEILHLKNCLAGIEKSEGVAITTIYGGSNVDGRLSKQTHDVVRVIVEADLMDSLEKLEAELEAL